MQMSFIVYYVQSLNLTEDIKV